ncbi:helix-turn-helix domain-containing protein [Actinomadura sp. 3N508]|uniref:helix-turn-helix domain-containing protein n=1 Tax=Actinomadura sp. 3N508 TaxID=3375153 RepID=UPI0037B1C471
MATGRCRGGWAGDRTGQSTAVDRRRGPAAAADRAAGQARIDPGPQGDDHHGVGVRNTGPGDHPPGRRRPRHRPGGDPCLQRTGLACLDPNWAGGRPRLISDEDIAFIIETAQTRPTKLGRPFTRWSVRKLASHLADHAERKIRIGRERLRQVLHAHQITFQRARTWKTSTDPDFDAELDRIEEVTTRFADRCCSRRAHHPASGPSRVSRSANGSIARAG